MNKTKYICFVIAILLIAGLSRNFFGSLDPYRIIPPKEETAMENNHMLTGVCIDRAIRITPEMSAPMKVSEWCERMGIPDAFWVLEQHRDNSGSGF